MLLASRATCNPRAVPWLSSDGHAGIAGSKSPWDQLLHSHGHGFQGTQPLAPPALLGTLGGHFAGCWKLLRAAPKLLSRTLQAQECAVTSSQSIAEQRCLLRLYYVFTTATITSTSQGSH